MNSPVEEKDKKFMFDMHCFDDGYVPEELPPPPPTFSEEELLAAKNKARDAAYKEGYDKGKAEEIASREQAVRRTLNKITELLMPLIEAESKRNERYEQEAVHLSLRIFETLYPHFTKQLGFEELKAQLSAILKQQRLDVILQVQTAPDMLDGVTHFLNELSAQSTHSFSFEVNSNDTLEAHEARLSWPDGGAFFQPEKTARAVLEILQQTLAQAGFTGHDKVTNEEIRTDAPKNDIVADMNTVETAQEDAPTPPEDMEKPDE